MTARNIKSLTRFSPEDLGQLECAFEAIGSTAEQNLPHQQCATVASALRQLAIFVESTGIAKMHRHAGRISEAMIFEANAEAAFDCIPESFRW
jgi:hypothetical protein